MPGIGALLNDGTLTYGKARAVIETFRYLSDADAATAEALILGQLAGKTYPQVLRLAEQAALTVDPDLAARRREQAQKRDARVILFREQQGTAGLSGRDLPPDEALAAMASVNARAQQYEDSGAFGDARMDVLRACAYLDLLNGVTAEARIACAQPQDEAADAAEELAWAEARAARAAEATAETDARSGTEARTGNVAQPPSEADTGDTGDAVHLNTRGCPCGECVDNGPSGRCAGCGTGPGGTGPGGTGPGGTTADSTGADGSGGDAGECGGNPAATGPRDRGVDVGEPGGDGPDGSGATGNACGSHEDDDDDPDGSGDADGGPGDGSHAPGSPGLGGSDPRVSGPGDPGTGAPSFGPGVNLAGRALQ